jgi:hypothetical protein
MVRGYIPFHPPHTTIIVMEDIDPVENHHDIIGAPFSRRKQQAQYRFQQNKTENRGIYRDYA